MSGGIGAPGLDAGAIGLIVLSASERRRTAWAVCRWLSIEPSWSGMNKSMAPRNHRTDGFIRCSRVKRHLEREVTWTARGGKT
jgi:hypothetical protein